MATFGAVAGCGAEVVAAGGAAADLAAAEGTRQGEKLQERGNEEKR